MGMDQSRDMRSRGSHPSNTGEGLSFDTDRKKKLLEISSLGLSKVTKFI